MFKFKRAKKRIKELEAQVLELSRRLSAALVRIKELEARLGKNSKNSSKPPSSDPPDVIPDKKKSRSKRKRGGQPGHGKQEKQLFPLEEVSEFEIHKPESCEGCGEGLKGEGFVWKRHQIVDLPEIKLKITEHQCYEEACLKCGVSTYAQLPREFQEEHYGPGVKAMAGLLSGKYRLSKRLSKEFFEEFYGLSLSLGCIPKLESRVSEALGPLVEEAHEYVKGQAVVCADETSWREFGKKAWVWLASTRWVSVFRIAKSRSAKEAKALLGEAFSGILSTDRYNGYKWVDLIRRQLCWAHLIRNFKGIVERGGKGKAFGSEMLEIAYRMFKRWYRVRDGTWDLEKLQQMMKKDQRRVGELLRKNTNSTVPHVSAIAGSLLKEECALWTFLTVEAVEPTNNQAERDIRKAVMWRKLCYGTDSEKGSRFAERILTTTESLRKQGRNAFSFLKEVCQAASLGTQPPSLLPN